MLLFVLLQLCDHFNFAVFLSAYNHLDGLDAMFNLAFFFRGISLTFKPYTAILENIALCMRFGLLDITWPLQGYIIFKCIFLQLVVVIW